MLEGLKQPDKTYPCAVRTMLETLNKDDAKILSDAINSDWSAKGLAGALRVREVILSDNSITRHRKGICSCLKI